MAKLRRLFDCRTNSKQDEKKTMAPMNDLKENSNALTRIILYINNREQKI